MVQLIAQIVKFILSAYGFGIEGVTEKVRENQHAKGLEAKVAILEAEIDRGDKTPAILEKILRHDEDGLPYFDWNSIE